MQMRGHFKNPGNPSESEEVDDIDGFSSEEDGELMFHGPVLNIAGIRSEEDIDDEETDEDAGDVLSETSSDSSEYYPEATDSDDLMDDDESGEDVQEKSKINLPSSSTAATTSTKASQTNSDEAAGGDGCDVEETARSSVMDMDENEEEDETVKAIIAAIKKPRSTPPEINLDDFVTDICFHPDDDIIALATITGDVFLYKYENEGNTLLGTIEVHAKACRDVEFTEDGCTLLTCSKDKSIMVTDLETHKLKKFYESAHDEAINKLHVIDENMFATGDDGGTVKLWDLRTKHEIFALKEVEDYVTQLLSNQAGKLLLVTSGDGYLTTLNIGARKLYVQSEPYEEELTCMGTYRGDSKLVAGTSKGNLYTFNWGQFGYHSDKFPGVKSPISEMIPITDRIACVAGEEGVIRAVHVAPFRILGVVGQHNMPIESLDVNHSGELIASSSHNNDVRFWNVKYFEDFGDIKYNEKHNSYKEKRHNLPSSKVSNASDFFADLKKEDDTE